MLHLLLTAALLAATPAGADETLTNDSVISLTTAGLGDEAIIAKIRSSSVKFDLSTDQLIALKSRNVSGPVIAAMIEASNKRVPAMGAMSMDAPDPMIPHPSGVYMLVEDELGGKMRRIDATVSSQAKTGGIFGYAFTGGIAPMSIKATIQNDTARVQTASHKPRFFFFFDESNASGGVVPGTWLAGTAAMVNSPNEFSLVRLQKKSGRREAKVGSVNIAGTKMGVMDEDRLGFDYDMVRPGVYEVTLSNALPAGEYGFLYSVGGGGAGGALNARIFDFSIH